MGDTSAEELLDAIDIGTGAVIATLPRSVVHERGLWHDVFHCLIVRPSSGAVILQRRAAGKAAFPDRIDLSVTGHLAAGEAPLQGAREAQEELGVEIDPARLIPLGTRLMVADAAQGGEGSDRERAHVFLLADDRPIESYRPPADEVSALLEVTVADLLRALADPEVTVAATQSVGGGTPALTTMCRAELVDSNSGYWVAVAVMAQRLLAGDEPLAI